MLPVRNIFDTCYPKAAIIWDDKSKKAGIAFDNMKIEFDYINQKIYVNSEEKYIDGVLEIKYNRLYIPLNSLKYALNLTEYDVYWDKNSNVLYLKL